MKTPALRALYTIPVLVLSLLLLGCASTPAHQEATDQPIVATKLVQSKTSWDGKLLPAYPTTQPEITILRIRIAANGIVTQGRFDGPVHHDQGCVRRRSAMHRPGERQMQGQTAVRRTGITHASTV